MSVLAHLAMNLLNQHLFLLLNADAHASTFSVWAGRNLAELPVVIALLLVALACYRQPDRWFFAKRTVFAVALGMGLALAIRCVYYNPRPFVLGLGNMLIEHDATTSFPSFHATFIFSLALPLLHKKTHAALPLCCYFLGLALPGQEYLWACTIPLIWRARL